MDESTYRKWYSKHIEPTAELGQSQNDYTTFADSNKPTQERLQAIQSIPVLSGEDPISQAAKVVQDKTEDTQLRIAALRSISYGIGKRDELLDMVINLLRDNSQPTELRLEALDVLQQNSFSSALFQLKRPAFMAALREVLDASDQTLREQALETLAQEKDEYAQRRILEGLQNPSKAIVPPAKAVQLLGYDIHAEYFPILREMVLKPPSAAAKREAIRLLAADPASKDLLLNILQDKKEARETRRVSAIALQSLSPADFQEQAKQIIMDEDEHADIRATSINALAHMPDQQSLRQDTDLDQRIKNLQSHSTSKEVKKSAARYLDLTSQDDQ